MSAKTVPVTVPPEVAAFVAEIGMQAPFEQMLEHALKCVPGLRSLTVELQEPYDRGGGPAVLFMGERENPFPEDDLTDREYGDWQVETFPPQVWQHFTLITYPEPPHAR